MSTYEARCASAARHEAPSLRSGVSVVTSQRIEAAIQRGRRQRSLAMWSMLQAVFGRPEAREQNDASEPIAEPIADRSR